MKPPCPLPLAGRPALAALALAGTLAAAEPPPRPAARAREFRLPLLRQNQQTGLLTGTGARTQPDGTLFLETARVEHHDPGGLTNLTLQVQTTACVVDLRQNRVRSAAALQVATADGQLTLEGVGFLWDQAAGELSVSNQVRTRIRKRPAAPASEPAGTLTITAEAMRLNLTAREVEFLGAVEVTDPELEVRARRLFARRDAAGRFDRLQVEGAVSLVLRRDGSRATGERAEYRLTDTGEEVELTGQPFWSDGVREAGAEVFRLLRPGHGGAELLQALGAATLKLPRDTNTLWELPWPGRAATPAPPPPPTAPARDGVELRAGAIWLALPPRPGPVQGLRAVTNVVIADTTGDWRATAAQAEWTNAVLELTGQPRWTGQGREVRAALLRLHPLERAVEARGEAWVRFPASPWLPWLTGRPVGRGGEGKPAEPVVEITAAAAVFRDGRLTFAPPVRARLGADGTEWGRLACEALSAHYRDRLEAVEAAGAVRLEQEALPGRPPRARQLECARLRVDFDATGHPVRLRAEGGVRGRQSAARRAGQPPEVTEVTAGWVEAHFAAGTNRLETAAAGGGVRLARGPRQARGEEAGYSAEPGVLELRGQPEVEAPEGHLTGATVLTWDPQRNRVGGRGPFQVRWTTAPLPGVTNVLRRTLSRGASPP